MGVYDYLAFLRENNHKLPFSFLPYLGVISLSFL